MLIRTGALMRKAPEIGFGVCYVDYHDCWQVYAVPKRGRRAALGYTIGMTDRAARKLVRELRAGRPFRIELGRLTPEPTSRMPSVLQLARAEYRACVELNAWGNGGEPTPADVRRIFRHRASYDAKRWHEFGMVPRHLAEAFPECADRV